MSDMIALIAEDFKVFNPVIKAFAILMVYNMISSQGNILGYDRASQTLAVSALDVWITITGF